MDDTARRSPAQLYALIFGIVLTAAGILGFFYNASFSTGDGLEADKVLGILAVNGWHNIVHLVTGLLGLAVASNYSSARAYAFGLGVVYIIVAIVGFASNGDIINLLPINDEDNVFHLLLGISGLAAGAATPAAPAPSTTATA